MYLTTATGICMKEVIHSCLRRAFSRKIMETLEVLNLIIIMLKSVSKGLFFNILSYYRPLNIVEEESRMQAICSSFYRQQQMSVGVLKHFVELTGKPLCPFFFIKLQASGLELYQKCDKSTQAFSCEFCEMFKNTFFKNSYSICPALQFMIVN